MSAGNENSPRPEGTATSDNERTDHIVRNFYLAATGVEPTPAQIQAQRDVLNAAAAQGSAQVQAALESFGRSMFAGQVNDANITNQQFVTNLSEGFLQRGPDGVSHSTDSDHHRLMQTGAGAE
jgi:hypothetical protein